MSDQLKTVSSMNKLYIGNLPIEADEAAVRQLFAEHNLTVADISVKRGGYAFVDFPDQSAADRAIDKLHGHSYCGLPLVVEPSVANKKTVTGSSLQSASATDLKESGEGPATGGAWSVHTTVFITLKSVPVPKDSDILSSDITELTNKLAGTDFKIMKTVVCTEIVEIKTNSEKGTIKEKPCKGTPSTCIANNE